MRSWMLGLFVTILGGAAMAADKPAAAPLTLERVFASPDLAGPQPRALKLSPDGTLLTSLRPRADERDRYDLWARDTRTGEERMLIDSKKLGSGAELSEAEKMQRERARIANLRGIVSYDWSPDSKAILVPLDGDLYIATLDGQVHRLGQKDALNATMSPDGRNVSFVRGQNLYSYDLRTGGTIQLTREGGGAVSCGTAEFVAQEEMHRFTGHWWAPNAAQLAVECYDESKVATVTRAAIGAQGTRTFEQRYPAAGTPNVTVSLWIMDGDSQGRVKVDLGPEPDIYLARVDWAPDGRSLLVQRQSRDQKTLDVLRVDPQTGRTTLLFTERAGARSWVNLNDDYRLLADGSLIWRSERDGYGHLYRFAQGQWTQLTSGPWVVTGLAGVDEAKGRLYFLGNKDDVLEQHLYAVDLARPNAIERLTERGWTNTVAMDAAATRAIVTRSNPGQPPQTYLADTSGNRLGWISENAVSSAGHPYHPYLANHRPAQFGTLTAADGSSLHYVMVTPTMTPGKRYPVFFQHYGGPGTGQEVSRRWQNPLVQYLVSQGWIFFELDNRGSYNRGKAFEDPIYRAMGTVEVADQLAGANWLKTQPFVDPKRIATFGWSYGGYMTLKMLGKNPGVYAAGVSGAPVTRWELYDTHYTERYLGTPQGDPRSYATSDAIEDALAIRDPLLLIHGMADDNVVFENSTELAARLQAANRPFEMMFYPGKTHAAARDIHVWTTIMAFLNREVRDKK